MAKTNPLPKGTRNVPVNMPEEMASALKELAEKSGMSVSLYCAYVLNDAVQQNVTVKHAESKLVKGSPKQVQYRLARARRTNP
jgi:hypothetical protein